MPTFETTEGTFLRNTLLAGLLGPDRGALAPASWIIHLWIDNPWNTALPQEADFGDYLPVEWDSDLWLPPSGGVIASDGLLDFGIPSTDSSDEIRYWSMHLASNDLPAHSWPLKVERQVFAGENAVRLRLEIPCGFNA